MKVFFLLALFALAAASIALPVEDYRMHGENGWYVPQQDGSWVWMDMEEAKNKLAEMEGIEDRGLTLTPVTYYLYTKGNPINGKKITTSNTSINSSNFNATNPTRFVMHGWTQSYLSSMNTNIRDAWLSKGDFNIIVVDWASARLDYFTSVSSVPHVGIKVASMIDFLVENYNMRLDNLVVIGHSLGAHVSGYAGKNIESGQIHTIIALDPALPLFDYDEPEKRLCSTDAFFVESIQTDGGGLGFNKPIGGNSCYPNGGLTQPGCAWGGCDHERSVTYYVEAVMFDNFPTIQCGTYIDANEQSCGSEYSSVLMGALTDASMVDGVFFVPVKSEAPFGMGN